MAGGLPVVRLGDVSTGHGCWPSRPNITASPNTFANGIPVNRQGDVWAVHCCVSCHIGYSLAGSLRSFANGVQIMRSTDPISCGDHCLQASSNVFAGN